MATKDVKEFNGWLNRSYARLKERLSIYGKIDEDAFHDAYLAVRKQIIPKCRDRRSESYFPDATGESRSRAQGGMKAVTTAPEYFK